MPQKCKQKTVDMKEAYSTSEVACLFGFSPRTLIGILDKGLIRCITIPGSSTRRVRHESLVEFAAKNPEYGYILTKIVKRT